MKTFVNALNQIVRERRSVKTKYYNNIPVDDTIVLNMLENARWAPTHGLTEPWRFIVFCGEGRKELSIYLSNLYKLLTPVEQYNEGKYEKLVDMPFRSSHIIYIGMKRQINGKITEIEEICAVACAVQNMLLTAEVNEIGCYWSTGSLSTSDELKPFLGLEKDDHCLGFLCIGNYDTKPPSTQRTEMDQKTIWYR